MLLDKIYSLREIVIVKFEVEVASNSSRCHYRRRLRNLPWYKTTFPSINFPEMVGSVLKIFGVFAALWTTIWTRTPWSRSVATLAVLSGLVWVVVLAVAVVERVLFWWITATSRNSSNREEPWKSPKSQSFVWSSDLILWLHSLCIVWIAPDFCNILC